MSGYRPKSKEEIRRNMSAIRSTDSKAEVALRSHLHRLGLRFRKNVRGIPGKPDVVFPTERVAVFVDGDFWHGRTFKEQGVEGLAAYFKKNPNYWLPKIARNAERDDAVSKELEDQGWVVIRLWETEVAADVSRAAQMIRHIVVSRRSKRD